LADLGGLRAHRAEQQEECGKQEMGLRQSQKRLLFLLAVTVFLLYLFSGDCKRAQSDREVALAAQVGFLKKKLALLQEHKHSVVKEGKIMVDNPSLPLIYVVTPTYSRPAQKAELTRLCQTLLLVTNVHWVVVEDAKVETSLVTNLLKRCGVPYTQLHVPTPPEWKHQKGEAHWRKPRGVLQRNEALSWIRENADRKVDGVLYFADDDNTYDVEIFEEMRATKKVSIWPVGLVGGIMVERAKLDKGEVI